jgi:hypothetical protein
MKHVSIFANEIEEIVGNPKHQIDFDYMFQNIRVIKNQWRNLYTPNEVKNKTKKNLMSMNIFQP